MCNVLLQQHRLRKAHCTTAAVELTIRMDYTDTVHSRCGAEAVKCSQPKMLEVKPGQGGRIDKPKPKKVTL